MQKCQMILTFVFAVDVHKLSPQAFAQRSMTLHGLHGFKHFQRKIDATAAVFVERCNRLALPFQALLQAHQDRRQRQIRVGIGARQAMFDA